jgi:hypothetical protein
MLEGGQGFPVPHCIKWWFLSSRPIYWRFRNNLTFVVKDLYHDLDPIY